MAVAIIMIGLVALVGVMPLATSHIGESKRKTTAVFLAQQRLEQVKNAEWRLNPAPGMDTLGGAGSIGDAALPAWPDEGYNTVNINGTPYPFHRRTVRMIDCGVAAGCGIPADPSLSTIRRVTVTVFYRPMTGIGMIGADEAMVQAATLISRRP
jgi:hypothetical protein